MIPVPNYTQVPNSVIDTMMGTLSGSEFKVLIAVCRKVIGWHKTSDAISYSQLKKLTGLENSACAEALKKLESLGCVSIDRTPGKTNRIDLNVDTSLESGEEPLRKAESTSPKSGETKETPQKKLSKETLHSPKAHAENLTRSITDYYQSLFEEEYQCKPTWDGKIMKLVKADISRLGDVLLGGLIQLFFEDPGPFVKKNGTGMGYNIFHSQIDALLEKKRRAG